MQTDRQADRQTGGTDVRTDIKKLIAAYRTLRKRPIMMMMMMIKIIIIIILKLFDVHHKLVLTRMGEKV